MAAGSPAQLIWNVDRASSLTIEPQADVKPEGAQGQVSVTPDATTEYTLTARNWIGLSTSAKTSVAVLKIIAFRATPDHLTQEKQEVVLHWETQGANSVSIAPGDEIKDPKPSGDATVHPTQPTTYILTASGLGVTAQSQVPVAIGGPAVKRFEVTQPAPGARIFPGDPVQLTWVADGSTSAKLTVSKGDVLPGKIELDVSAGSPATVRPATSGELTYTLTVSNAAGSTQSTTKIAVQPIGITQFESDPASIFAGEPSKVRWRVEGANDTTSITIEPGIGKVEPTGERALSPTESTEYVLTVKGSDGVPIERRTGIAVRAPLPQISVFTAPRASITKGEGVSLTWSVQGAEFVEIRTGTSKLITHSTQPQGSAQDSPAAPTTYILTAVNSSGQVTKDFSVDVKEPPTPVSPPAIAPPPTGP